jgi:GT2 family glycosyltransferase
MTERLLPKSSARIDYRQTIHLLNQRYHEQWERAERLEKEVAELRSRWLGPLRAWLRSLKRWVRPVRYTGRPGTRPGELGEVPCRLLEEAAVPAGRVSIVIPFKDQLGLLRGCLRSLGRGTYRDFEVVLVDNGSAEACTRRYLERARARPRRAVVECPGAFNFSRLCNEGARQAAGEFLLFLNNDTEVFAPDWLERLLAVAGRPDVGIVGATLLYPDRTIQHAGLFPRPDGRWAHGYRGLPEDSPGDQGELHHVRTVPAVTAACLLIRREFFWSLGGFDERLPTTYNDVDLCCRARDRGRLVAVTPHATLLHFEALSRGYSTDRPGSGHLSALGRPAEMGRWATAETGEVEWHGSRWTGST